MERRDEIRGEKDPLVGTVIYRWSFNYREEFILYKCKLSTSYIYKTSCTAWNIIELH